MNSILDIVNVSKQIGDQLILSDINLSVPDNSVYGIIGKNGAGKSTLIKLILGFLQPTVGSLKFKSSFDTERPWIGYLPEFPDYHVLFTCREYLLHLARISGLNNEESLKKVEEILELVNIKNYTDRKMNEYSKGMLQKVGIAQTLINNAEIIILDEPFSGLDPYTQKEMCDIIWNLKKLDKTVIVCSHILTHIEKTCSEVAVIHEGKIIRSGSISDMLEKKGYYKLECSDHKSPVIKEIESEFDSVYLEEDKIIFREETDGDKEAIIRKIIDSGLRINELTKYSESLDLFFNMIISGDNGYNENF